MSKFRSETFLFLSILISQTFALFPKNKVYCYGIQSSMQGSNYLLLFIFIAIILGIAGFNFQDFSYEENKEEYILLLMAIILAVIYLSQRSKISKK
jgi:Ca2+/Na+ antiporter